MAHATYLNIDPIISYCYIEDYVNVTAVVAASSPETTTEIPHTKCNLDVAHPRKNEHEYGRIAKKCRFSRGLYDFRVAISVSED